MTQPTTPDTNRWIPLFPLPLVALPGDLVPLHIFEPRYRSLIADCLDAAESGAFAEFGICLFHEEQLHDWGCLVRIDKILQRYPDGRLDILTHGTRPFRLLRVRDEKTYREAQVGLVEDAPDEVPEPELLRRVESLCEVYSGLVQPGGTVAGGLPDQPPSFRLAGQAVADPLIRQSLLEKSGERERLVYLAAFFEKAIPRLRKLEEINHRVKTNGHFKKIPGGEESLAE